MGNTSEEIICSRKRAALSLVVVALFAAAFIGVASFLHVDRSVDHRDDLQSWESSLEDPFYVLLIGSDSRKGTALYTGKANEHAQLDQHSDIMTLVRVDPKSYTVTLVTVPRDTQLAGESGKINDALLDNDPAEVVDVVERLTGVSIDYYMMTAFIPFQSLVDGLGGTVVDVPLKITVDDPSTGRDVTVQPGNSKLLDGSEALVLARARKEYGSNQDALRQVNVRNIEMALIEQVLSDSHDVEGAVSVLKDHTDTDMDYGLIAALGIDFALNKEKVTIYSCTGPHEGFVNEAGRWVIPEDQETWQKLMRVVNAGEDPSGIVEPPSFSPS